MFTNTTYCSTVKQFLHLIHRIMILVYVGGITVWQRFIELMQASTRGIALDRLKEYFNDIDIPRRSAMSICFNTP